MISAVVLTHNDTLTIEDTLKSLSWADELVVVDDNSTDNTAAHAKALGAKVYSHPLAGDFATQRNFGLSKARGEWVLFVDSDEVVAPALAHEIQTRIQDAGIAGYGIARKDILWGKPLAHGEVGRMRLLRLAKKDAGRWVRPVHEVWEIKGKTSAFTQPLLHYPHPDVAQFLSHIDRYSTINANYLYAQKVRAGAWQIIAYPTAKFFINYIWRLGFLDGMQGAIVAIMMSLHSFLTRAKVWQLRARP
jgi:glycosyltransferase involved in cell wall biosynthesis